MPIDDGEAADLAARINSIEQAVRRLTENVGYRDIEPDDPVLARRWSMSLLDNIHTLRESLHQVRNSLQPLTGMMDILNRKLDRNAELSSANAESLTRLVESARALEVIAEKIEREITHIVHEEPLLMRNLWWMDTNATEFLYTIYVTGEGFIFVAQQDDLIKSIMFRSIAVLIPSATLWGIICLLLGGFSAVGFMSRRRSLRTIAAAGIFVYYGATGIPPLWLASGVLGWLPHLVACIAAGWVASRGPSGAI